MPTKPAYVHSHGCPDSYALIHERGFCELRNGCAVVAGLVVAWSADSAAWIRANCWLTPEQDARLDSVIALGAGPMALLKGHVHWAGVSPAHGSRIKEGE